MSSSTPTLKFLIDENVRTELTAFLKKEKYNVKTIVPKSSDSEISALSKKELRILITNDSDFSKSLRTEIYSVVWLRIPQWSSNFYFLPLKNYCKNAKFIQVE